MTRFPRDWDDDVVRQYLTLEATQKSREKFQRTYINIDEIQADYLFPYPSNDEFVTQEEFRDAILKSNIGDRNRVFALRGEVGGGVQIQIKSEGVCFLSGYAGKHTPQWEYRPDRRRVC